jgi:hypothetical protein
MIICGGHDLLSEQLSIIPLGIHYVGGANPRIRIHSFLPAESESPFPRCGVFRSDSRHHVSRQPYCTRTFIVLVQNLSCITANIQPSKFEES